MSNSLPPKPRIVGPKVRICIVASKYNEQFTDALVENAIEELGELVPQGRIDLIRVPGAFEIPVMVASVLDRDPPACIIALGLIIRGSTEHADLVGRSVTDSLQRLAIESIELPEPIWVEVKFNWSHAQSSPHLVHVHGGKLGDAYWNPTPKNYRICWMARNEDFFCLRWTNLYVSSVL